ncbi:MAG: hypothetical protein AXW15_02325 [Neptuniibacter sp. Phe_28]|nr:MAG: hypothetical protein AXW15_02325 [Neptuniibacter sp. Phe_28]
MKLKSKPFRIAVAGATTDGRVIERDWLEQMAANYNPEKYMARINCEHFRGIMPNGEFKAFGNVVALSTQTVKIDGEDKLALYATIEPTPELVDLNRKGQKIFTSMEVDPAFADSDTAYLVGLAVTDSPASLGTEMLQFAAGQKDNNPLATRKLKPENLFSSAVETEMNFADESTLGDRLKDLFNRSKKQESEQSDKNEDFAQAVMIIGEEVSSLTAALDELKSKFSALGDGESSEVSTLKTELENLQDEFTTLKTELEKQPNSQFKKRPPATGGDLGEQATTDC